MFFKLTQTRLSQDIILWYNDKKVGLYKNDTLCRVDRFPQGQPCQAQRLNKATPQKSSMSL